MFLDGFEVGFMKPVESWSYPLKIVDSVIGLISVNMVYKRMFF